MVTVVQTHSVSWAESVRIALIGAGIDAVILDPYSVAGLGLGASVRVAILNDADLPRASAILAELRPPKAAPLASWWWHKRALAALSVAFVTLYLGVQAADGVAKPMVVLALSGVSAILFVASFALLLLGYRADKRQRNDAQPDVEPGTHA